MSRLRIFILSPAVAGITLLAGCSPSAPELESAPPASVAGIPISATMAGSDSTALVVYKESACPCCNSWVDYMRRNGFRVVTYDVSDLDAVKQKHNIAGDLQSCHTTEVGGYYVEGHVPADLVRRLLSERPRIAGITVPGMPVGSPGMEVGPPEPYDILTADSAGRTAVFARRGQ